MMNIFSEVDAQRILQISLARLPQDDFLAWRGEPTGEYTVRSGYRLLLHGNSINNNGYNPSENRKCYKNLWKSDLPSKLKITAWRATLNYLPTLSNLRTKRLITDDVCPRCKQEVENRNHVFRDCTGLFQIAEWISVVLFCIPSGLYDLNNVKQGKLAFSLITAEWRPPDQGMGFAAEAVACLQAVLLGRDLGLQSVVIEGDSLLTIQWLRESLKQRSIGDGGEAYQQSLC